MTTPTKITLVTPPDIYQNDHTSVLFIEITEEEQDAVTSWLKNNNAGQINIYFYQGEYNVPWLLHSLACCHHAYANVNNMSGVAQHLMGYVLGKSKTYYSCDDVNISQLYSHINVNRVSDAVEFLEMIFAQQ